MRELINADSTVDHPWMLDGNGMATSEPTAALLSPGRSRVFGAYYNGTLVDAFGGVVVHSCGDCSHIVPAMLETPGLSGLDLTMPENTDWTALESAAGDGVLSLRGHLIV